MTALKKPTALRAEVVKDPTIMSGNWVVRGTRIPAMTIVAYLRDGYTNRDTFEDYPSLPLDGIEAVKEWARRELGPDWKNAGALIKL